MLSGCCVRCQQPVEMLRLKSGTPRFVSECIYVYVAVSESFERVLCCLDVASVVSSLSRCCVSSQVPRDL